VSARGRIGGGHRDVRWLGNRRRCGMPICFLRLHLRPLISHGGGIAGRRWRWGAAVPPYGAVTFANTSIIGGHVGGGTCGARCHVLFNVASISLQHGRYIRLNCGCRSSYAIFLLSDVPNRGLIGDEDIDASGDAWLSSALKRSDDSTAGSCVERDKQWYGLRCDPPRLVLYGAQKVAKTKRDVDGGRYGRVHTTVIVKH